MILLLEKKYRQTHNSHTIGTHYTEKRLQHRIRLKCNDDLKQKEIPFIGNSPMADILITNSFDTFCYQLLIKTITQ